ncbi:MAG: universal stress protein [Planctomycetota bacterium]
MKTDRILVPVDFSEHSLAVIPLATVLAESHAAKLCFIYAAPPFFSEEVLFDSDVENSPVEAEIRQLEQLRPADGKVPYEHLMLYGHPGPSIVAAAEDSDICVISTEGRTGLSRFLVGSVAQYVLQHAPCPVVLVRGLSDVPDRNLSAEFSVPITRLMHHVKPVHAFHLMSDVSKRMEAAGESCAPVTDDMGRCIGVLTTTDIERYLSLQRRFESRDESVLDEMFETNELGQRRCSNHDFNQVKRHMSASLISLPESATVADALTALEAHPGIHHLVILDAGEIPVGVVSSLELISKTGIAGTPRSSSSIAV